MLSLFKKLAWRELAPERISPPNYVQSEHKLRGAMS